MCSIEELTADVNVANRITVNLQDIAEKVYSLDLFSKMIGLEL